MSAIRDACLFAVVMAILPGILGAQSGAPVPAKATVQIFVSTDCPVSNRYAPEIARLYREFSPQGIRFQLIYPNKQDADGAIERHRVAFALPDIAQQDRAHQLVTRAGATVTPEAAVFDSKMRLLYRGRIDNRFVELGRERPVATEHDLRNALASVLAGAPVNPARTQAVGCFIADMK